MRKDAASAPGPRSLGELADPLQHPGSVALVLPHLTLPCLQVAEALAALGVRATRDSLAEWLGSTSPAAVHALDSTLEALSDRTLVWHDGNGTLRMPAPLRQAWSTPLGLDAPLEELLADTTSEERRGMPAVLGVKPPGTKKQRLAALVAHHSDAERVTALVAGAPAATRELLEQHARPAPRPSPFIVLGAPGGPQPGARWALDRGLPLQDRHRYGPVRMPVEVALALRGPGWQAPFTPLPPGTRLAPVTAAEVEREATAAATAFAAHAATVLSVGASAPPTRLKSGGIGARELPRLDRAAQADDAVVRLTLETAYAAGLLARDGDRVPPTEAYDAWAEQEPAERLVVLLRAWRDLPLIPTPARDGDNKALPALAGGLTAAAACKLATGFSPRQRGSRQGRACRPLRSWGRSWPRPPRAVGARPATARPHGPGQRQPTRDGPRRAPCRGLRPGRRGRRGNGARRRAPAAESRRCRPAPTEERQAARPPGHRDPPSDMPTAVEAEVLADRLLKARPTAPEPDPFGGGMPFATDTEEIVGGYTKHLSYSDVRRVAHAVETGAAITVEYITASGNRTVRTLSDLELDPPYLDAWCHLREAERVFTLSRVHGVLPA